MDQMLPSPGFSIPSIGTPFQQLEEDQTIIANNPYYAQNALNMNHPPTGLTPAGMGNSSTNNNGVGSSGLNTNVETSSASASLPSLMNTPTKASSYQPSYAPTPQSMMQPQTPVCFDIVLHFLSKNIIEILFCIEKIIAKSNVADGANDGACNG